MTDSTSATSDPSLAGEGPLDAKPARSVGRFAWLTLVGAALVVGFFYGLDYTLRTFTHESTDDAFLDNAILQVAPRVAGQVEAVHVHDNQFVKAGDLLVELDAHDYEVRLAQKRAATASADANLESAKAAVGLVKARYETAQATERQEHANADAARAKSQRAQADLKRNETLRQTGVVSAEEFDRVRADAESTAADFRAAEQKAEAATSQVVEAHAQIGVAQAMLASAVTRTNQASADEQAAKLDLSYTKIFAPSDGWVTRKALSPGTYVQVGQALFALVPARPWVTANFKETELTHMRGGQPVEIRIDAYPARLWRGHVDSIMAGSGSRFSLLPPENAVGNYVKIVQRVPVKILFDEPLDPAMSLGPGMSVIPAVRVSDFTLAPAVLWAAAVVLAVLTTLGLARVVAHLRD